MWKRFSCLTIAILVIGAFGIAYAQETATLSGDVTDRTGLAILGAQVRAANNATGVEVTGLTGATGAYELTPGVRGLHDQGRDAGLRDGRRQ